jgi:hypothetical protein
MATATEGAAFSEWLAGAKVGERKLTPDQAGVLRGAHRFLGRCGRDYYSLRILGHFLLHCGSGLKVAEVARLVGVSRPTASGQQGMPSKGVVRDAHHRMAGRPHGKLLPRHAGSVAQFLATHPAASRADVLDFVEGAWGVRVSTVALYHFMKKYGLDAAGRRPVPAAAAAAAAAEVRVEAAGADATSRRPAPILPAPAAPAAIVLPAVAASAAAAPPFSATRATRGRSSCSPRR